MSSLSNDKDNDFEELNYLWTAGKDRHFLEKVGDNYIVIRFVSGQKMAMVIEDDDLANRVVKKMIESGCGITL